MPLRRCFVIVRLAGDADNPKISFLPPSQHGLFKPAANGYSCMMQRTYPVKLHLLSIAPLALLLCALWGLLGSEKEITLFFTHYRNAHPTATWWIELYTNTGNAFFYIFYAALFWWGIRKEKPELTRFVLAYVLAQLLVGFVLGRIFKFAIGRPRPLFDGPFTPLAFDSGHHSFPSGHTTEIIGAGLPLIQRYKSVILALLLSLVTATMGFSRIYLSAHHPSDVAGGIILGSVAGYLAWRFAHWPLYWWRRRDAAGKKRPWRGV